MGDGPPRFRPGFPCPTLLGYQFGESSTWPTGLSPAVAPRSRGLRLMRTHPFVTGPTTPPGDPDGLGSSRFARRYYGSRGCFLFLRVLRCFSSPGLDGHSGLNARSAAPPDLSQPSTPVFLMTPRHPPRALRSLTTPIRRPHPGVRFDRSNRTTSHDDPIGRVRSPLTATPRRLTTRRPALGSGNDSLSVRVHQTVVCGEIG